jgi:NAD(P)-dependent dehydrogenase (short-subunit alcohol dehydrogenase family)
MGDKLVENPIAARDESVCILPKACRVRSKLNVGSIHEPKAMPTRAVLAPRQAGARPLKPLGRTALMSFNDLSLRDRVVLVTGGTKGLGYEMAAQLLADGARVCAIGSAAAHDFDMPAASPDRTLYVQADVRRFEDAARAVHAAVAHFGDLHVLINNAGRGMRLISETFNVEPTKFWETDIAAWHDIIDVNVNGAFHFAKAAATHFVGRKFGKIINVSTSAHTMIRRGFSPYGPSKAALEAASRIWAEDLKPYNVDVNVYLPGGAADTALVPGGADRKGADGLLLPAAIMRRGIGWLCSDASNGWTGERFVARLWDENLPPDQAAMAARLPYG